MRQPSIVAHRAFTCLSLLLVLSWLLPVAASAAKTLASEALTTAIATDSLDEVKEAMLMDLYQRQRFEFDEAGMESLGRDLIARGDPEKAVEILQLNQMTHLESPGAANALGDAYRATGDDISARVYYDVALNMDPENEHAKQATAEQGDATQLAMGAMEMSPEAMQAAMAQAGVEISPEQMQEMQQAMAQMEAYQQNPSAYQAPDQKAQTSRPQKAAAPSEPQHESEFCEVLHRFNAEKRIEDSRIRSRVEGHYSSPGDTMRNWNVQSACGDFLIAVPLWADVSPPVMVPSSDDSFEDAIGGRWVFQMDGDGKATSVTHTDAQGTVTKMVRLGDPKSLS